VGKRPFDIDEVIRRVRRAVEPFPKAALFELADDGHRSPFEQLVACILSIRTRDEVMLPTARALFQRARTPATVLALGELELDSIVHASTFHAAKARQILEIARELVDGHGGELGCDRELLLSFHGVGPKCTNLVLGIACGEPCIGVDVHVHRVTNRWGYVSARTPEGTMRALEERLPERDHVEINRLLVPFGKHVCTGRLPKCSTCPVLEYCRQVGVEAHR
jgi:endonuclease-3